MSDKVSIVIPSYNVEEFLPDCLESIFAQTYENTEVVIVDSSTDSTPRIVDKYVDRFGESRIKMFPQEKSGPAAARNFGILHCTGEYVAFLDGDDKLCIDSVEKRLRKMKETENCGLVYTDAFVLNQDIMFDKSYSEIVDGSCEGQVFSRLIRNNYVCTSTAMAPRKVLQEVGMFDEGLKNAEDYGLWLKISGKGYNVGFINEKLSYYRIRKGSLSDDNLKNAEYLIALFTKLKTESEDFSEEVRALIDRKIERHMSDYHIIKTKRYILEGRYDDASIEYGLISEKNKSNLKYRFISLLLKFNPGILKRVLEGRKNHRGV